MNRRKQVDLSDFEMGCKYKEKAKKIKPYFDTAKYHKQITSRNNLSELEELDPQLQIELQTKQNEQEDLEILSSVDKSFVPVFLVVSNLTKEIQEWNGYCKSSLRS